MWKEPPRLVHDALFITLHAEHAVWPAWFWNSPGAHVVHGVLEFKSWSTVPGAH